MQDSQIRWRLRRGMKELDVILTRHFEQRYPQADAAERAAFLTLLDHEDPDLWAWVMGYRLAPEGALGDVIEQLRGRA